MARIGGSDTGGAAQAAMDAEEASTEAAMHAGEVRFAKTAEEGPVSSWELEGKTCCERDRAKRAAESRADRQARLYRASS